MSPSACVLAIVLLLGAESEPSESIVRRAETHFDRGLKLQEEKQVAAANDEFMKASVAFGEAYALTKEAPFLYAQAQSERLAGHCDAAVKHYDEFLATDPAPEEAQKAQVRRELCLKAPAAPVTPPPKVAPQPGDTEPRPSHGPRRKWVRDPAGGVLVALGGLTGIIGASLIGFATTRDGSAVSAGNEDEYLNRKEAARVQHRVGIAAVAVGGAMLIAGVTRWGVLAARERKQRASAGVTGWRRGAALTVSVWF
jgi:hypothetical protein